MTVDQLISTARELVAPGKGILAADESFGTIKKRFEATQIENTEENRRAYRDLLFTTPGIEGFISGVIMFDETIHQKTSDGIPFAQFLASHGIVPGIKVDAGAKDLPGHPGEKITEGLDGLRERLQTYSSLGARFAKWRAVINIGEGIPSLYALRANAHALGRYAALCQEAGIVPIVEPEVIMDGSHDITRAEAVTTAALEELFAELSGARVLLEGTLLKPNMVVPGKSAAQQASARQVAEASLRSYYRAVPAAVPGIVFLSGGLSPERATEFLNEMNKLGPHPWQLSFSYGRALQEPPMNTWHGAALNVAAAQRAFFQRARLNSEARYGRYQVEMERTAA